MVFSSLIFLYAFFSLSLLAYALCRSQKQQNVVLLIFSLIFYCSHKNTPLSNADIPLLIHV